MFRIDGYIAREKVWKKSEIAPLPRSIAVVLPSGN